MSNSFREHHIFQILKSQDALKLPLDSFLRTYFRQNKSVGSKDRKFICDALYGMIRWRGLLDHISPKPLTWENRYRTYQNFDPHQYINDTTLPPHIRVSFPKSLYQHLAASYGDETAFSLCLTSNTTAPTTIRANALKTTRDTLLQKWKNEHPVEIAKHSPLGLVFHKKINFFSLEEFKEGLFEVQDEGSQLVANLVAALPGQEVLDFCAGSGGKTLAFSPRMEGKGQIYLHDKRDYILQEAKKRLRRAGVQNAQLLFFNDSKKKHLKQRMDWVLCDVPCSGTGTLRRNPDMKWKFEIESIANLRDEQRQIFEEALAFMHPKGKIVYATCSIFPEENEQQIAYFLEKYSLELVGEPFRSFPEKGGMDGFFGAVLQKRVEVV